MAGIELLSDQGFRVDGRRPHELRKIQCRMGVFRQADGSAYIEQGNTKALATVYGPHEVRQLPSALLGMSNDTYFRHFLRLTIGPYHAYIMMMIVLFFSSTHYGVCPV